MKVSTQHVHAPAAIESIDQLGKQGRIQVNHEPDGTRWLFVAQTRSYVDGQGPKNLGRFASVQAILTPEPSSGYRIDMVFVGLGTRLLPLLLVLFLFGGLAISQWIKGRPLFLPDTYAVLGISVLIFLIWLFTFSRWLWRATKDYAILRDAIASAMADET